MKTIFKDESAQVGGIMMVVGTIIIVGFLVILLGAMVQSYVDANNDLINNPNLPYSQERKDAMSMSFLFWWGIPLITILIVVIYAIKTGIKTEIGY